MKSRDKIYHCLIAMLGEKQLISVGLAYTYDKQIGWVLYQPRSNKSHVIGHISNLHINDVQNPVRRALYAVVPCKLFAWE